MISVRGVSRWIAGRQVLRQVDLHVKAGTITALCGPNGAGKTTLLRIVLGLIRPDKGEISLGLSRRHVSFLFHSPCLFEELTLIQNCRFFAAARGRRLDSVGLDYWCRELDLKEVMRRRVGTLSRGMQQRADLVRVLVEKPALMILDEPTSNLDPMGKIRIREILRELVAAGCTLLVTSHLLGEMEKLAHQVGILNRGALAWCGDVRQDLESEDLEAKFMAVMAAENGGAA